MQVNVLFDVNWTIARFSSSIFLESEAAVIIVFECRISAMLIVSSIANYSSYDHDAQK